MGLVRDVGVICLHCGVQFAGEALPLVCPSTSCCYLLVMYPEPLPTRVGGCLFGEVPAISLTGACSPSPGECFLASTELELRSEQSLQGRKHQYVSA